jgi:hypothetical protein
MAAAAAAVEAEAELHAFKQASFDRRSASAVVEVQTQALQHGHGCGWGLGDDDHHPHPHSTAAAPRAAGAARGPPLAEELPRRVDRRVRVQLGRVDLVAVPETALATAELLVAGFGDSHLDAAQPSDPQDGSGSGGPSDDDDDDDDDWLLEMLHAPPILFGIVHERNAQLFNHDEDYYHHGHHGHHHHSGASQDHGQTQQLSAPVVVVGGDGSHDASHDGVSDCLSPGDRCVPPLRNPTQLHCAFHLTFFTFIFKNAWPW